MAFLLAGSLSFSGRNRKSRAVAGPGNRITRPNFHQMRNVQSVSSRRTLSGWVCAAVAAVPNIRGWVSTSG